MTEPNIDPVQMLRPRRAITGMSAILLPFTAAGAIDWPAFHAHVARTAAAGLTPAVNMDTGYVNLLDDETRTDVLARTRAILDGTEFVAGAFVADRPGDHFYFEGYQREITRIQEYGGTPVIFQSYGLTQQPPAELIESYRRIADECDRFIAFELGRMFAPFGSIYSLDVYAELLRMPRCLGAKHSSLDRQQEWQRLKLRDEIRPDFKVFTGNDLAIDMVMYGSDYLLGLSTMAPDLFARRDRWWAEGDPRFYELNDALQYLGFFAFRAPVPAYKHTAAQFLRLRGWIDSDHTHPDSPKRPDSDIPILQELLLEFRL
jgi:dihydrodipicolinate synthase/N-acetylneuraminate lyase